VNDGLLGKLQSILENHPQSLAVEIAQKLNTTKKSVNSLLYSHKEIFEPNGDTPPRWRLRSNTRINHNSHVHPPDDSFQRNVTEWSGVTAMSVLEECIDDISTILEWCSKQRPKLSISKFNEGELRETVTTQWIKLNTSKNYRTTAKKHLKVLTKKNKVVPIQQFIEYLFDQGERKLAENYLLMILLGGSISVVSLIEHAANGNLEKHIDLDYLKDLTRDKDLKRLCDDLGIVNRRAQGETLEDISRTMSLTRERVRQRQKKISDAYGLQNSRSLIREQKQQQSEMILIRAVNSFLGSHPGVNMEQLAARFSVSPQKLRRSIHPGIRKFVMSPRKTGTNSMAEMEILEALRQAATYEYPLSGPGFDDLVAQDLIRCVSRVRVMQIFGTWSNACDKAGVESIAAVRPYYDRIWTENDLWEYVIDFLLTPEIGASVGSYDTWAKEKPGDRPSVGTLRNYLGPWSEVVAAAALKLRLEPYSSRFKIYLERYAGTSES
jgi:hypothetical protein